MEAAQITQYSKILSIVVNDVPIPQMQLNEITRIVEMKHIVPAIDSHEFRLSQINDAIKLVNSGHTNGKVVVRFP